MCENSNHIETDQKEKFKLIDFLNKRLDHTITHTQTATKLIYTVNGAILTMVYFELGNVKPIKYAFLIAGFLTLLLCIINFLHSNFIAVQYSWYQAIDEEIRKIFNSSEKIKNMCSVHFGECQEKKFESYKGVFRIFPFNKGHKIYVYIHLIVAFFLLFTSVIFFYCAYDYSTCSQTNNITNDEIITGKHNKPNPVDAKKRRN